VVGQLSPRTTATASQKIIAGRFANECGSASEECLAADVRSRRAPRPVVAAKHFGAYGRTINPRPASAAAAPEVSRCSRSKQGAIGSLRGTQAADARREVFRIRSHLRPDRHRLRLLCILSAGGLLSINCGGRVSTAFQIPTLVGGLRAGAGSSRCGLDANGRGPFPAHLPLRAWGGVNGHGKTPSSPSYAPPRSRSRVADAKARLVGLDIRPQRTSAHGPRQRHEGGRRTRARLSASLGTRSLNDRQSGA